MQERRKRPRGRYRRFIDRYEQRQRDNRQRPPHPVKRAGRIALGVLLLIVGPILGALPGPGGIFIVLAGMFILAGEFRRVALVLDRGEEVAMPRARRFWHRLRRFNASEEGGSPPSGPQPDSEPRTK